ncbi:MAG: Hsp20/alpha crystallin family protein [Lewinellaceae bacterium]|nr:Hsp20/alpha crystallin family protein [Lewinellaceae bacterium]
MEDFFNRDISNFIGTDVSNFRPAVNITEDNKQFVIALAAPGFEKRDFEVKTEGKQLTILGKHEVDTEKTDAKYTRREFQKSAFTRHFTLPDSVNNNELAAVYHNGVLEISLPKKEDQKPSIRTIEIGG